MLDCIGPEPASALNARAAAVVMSALTDYVYKHTRMQKRQALRGGARGADARKQ
jgi:hypothetical protein